MHTSMSDLKSFSLVRSHSSATSGYFLESLFLPSYSCIATGTSSGKVIVAPLSGGNDSCSVLHGIQNSSVQALDVYSSGVMAAALDGTVCLWDLRCHQPFRIIKTLGKTFAAAVHSSDNIVAVGQGAEIQIWDLRTGNILKTFPDVHTEDVTRLQFHSGSKDLLFSASEDGLVCVNDVTLDADDSLVNVLNTEDSVHRIGLFGPGGKYMFCLSHTEQFSIWNVLDSRRVNHWKDARERLSRTGVHVDYLVDCFYKESEGRLNLVGGNHDGVVVVGEVHAIDIVPASVMCKGHNGTVRCLAYGVTDREHLFTGSEDGMLCQWQDAKHTSIEQSLVGKRSRSPSETERNVRHKENH